MRDDGTTIVSVAPRPRPRLIAARLIALAALASQVVAISDQLLVAHVTCPVDGERVHVGAAQTLFKDVAPGARVEQAALDGDGHSHAQCLVDEDVDQLPPRIVASPFVPAPEAVPVFPEVSTALASAAFPIYRLAPKNSPPA